MDRLREKILYFKTSGGLLYDHTIPKRTSFNYEVILHKKADLKNVAMTQNTISFYFSVT